MEKKFEFERGLLLFKAITDECLQGNFERLTLLDDLFILTVIDASETIKNEFLKTFKFCKNSDSQNTKLLQSYLLIKDFFKAEKSESVLSLCNGIKGPLKTVNYILGEIALKDLRLSDAAKYFKAGAKLNSANAFYSLGVMSENDLIENYDLLDHIDHFAKSASLGPPRAQNQLGLIHEEGLRLSNDYKRVLNYYNESASIGFGGAYYNLAKLYYDKNNYSKAADCFKKSAGLGNIKAYIKLHKMHLGSNVVDKLIKNIMEIARFEYYKIVCQLNKVLSKLQSSASVEKSPTQLNFFLKPKNYDKDIIFLEKYRDYLIINLNTINIYINYAAKNITYQNGDLSIEQDKYASLAKKSGEQIFLHL